MWSNSEGSTMAESLPLPSTFQKSSIEKQGAVLLIPNTTPFDPLPAVSAVFHASENGGSEEGKGERNEKGDEELRNAVEREIYRLSLEQAEFEAIDDFLHEVKDSKTVEKDGFGEENNEKYCRNAVEREIYRLSFEQAEFEVSNELEAIDDFLHEVKDSKTVEEDGFDEGNNEKYGGSVEGEIENEGSEEGKCVKMSDIAVGQNGKDTESVEDARGNGWGDEEIVGGDDFGEENNEKYGGSVEGEFENEGSEEGKCVKRSDIDVGQNGKDTESVENESGNEWGDEEIVGGQLGEGASKIGRYNNSNNWRRTDYPMRPEAEDCAYYMKFGSCKFRLSCKFNHPLRRKNQGVQEKLKHTEENSERAGQTECKFHLTSGGCKYGRDCKYYHVSVKNSPSHFPELNFLGLPIRLGELECPYYMRTGSCKYGSTCRFHHPDPSTVGGGDRAVHGNGGFLPSKLVSSTSISPWSSPRAFSKSSPYPPVKFPSTRGAPPPIPDWNRYQAAYPTSEGSLPTPPAFAMNHFSTEINFSGRYQHDMAVDEYPERPGEPECSFFLKTGDCKFKSSCKFHHPKYRSSKSKAKPNSYALSDKGLPLRPDQLICTHYQQYGICKYGPSCKYDHPSKLTL